MMIWFPVHCDLLTKCIIDTHARMYTWFCVVKCFRICQKQHLHNFAIKLSFEERLNYRPFAGLNLPGKLWGIIQTLTATCNSIVDTDLVFDADHMFVYYSWPYLCVSVYLMLTIYVCVYCWPYVRLYLELTISVCMYLVTTVYVCVRACV